MSTTDPRPIDDHDLSRLSVALASDALDLLGYRSQVLDEALGSLVPGRRFAGWARTIRVHRTDVVPDEPYVGEMNAISALGPGDVAVYAVDGSVRAALFGELFSIAARSQGAIAAVVDGYARDLRQLRESGFPVFARGTCAYDTRGRAEVVAFDCEIVCGGVNVAPGDLVVGDDDGVVVVPAVVAATVVGEAMAKLEGENGARGDLVRGRTVSEVWDKWRVF